MPYEHPLGNEKELKTHINDDLWLISDIHLSSNIERTKRIINQINKAVGKDGYINNGMNCPCGGRNRKVDKVEII